ncbi:MAG: flagellar biosynthesis protein FliQ [Chitinivibrionales bacterium]|nr:flagellar biosynthesis protein FliQ [Chitinivibrionales bacterium]
MSPQLVVDIGTDALYITILLCAPLLFAGLIVGLIVGIFQAVTQIHEMTLTFIPKILVMIGLFVLLLPWMLMKIMNYTVNLIALIPQAVK